jgi:acetylornithine/N-succinyldiaminopimelate aminotransferase
VRALGSTIWDKEGRQYLDLYGGHAVISIGHSHPHYVKKVSEQLSQIGFYSNSVIIEQQHELATKLGELSGYADYQLFLCNSGAEANENALKLASFHTGRKKIIAFQKAFHGRTSLAVASTDDKSIQAPVNENEHILFLPFNDLEALEKHMDESICAVIVEGIQGVAGVHVASAAFLKKAKALCEKAGALLIVDEIQSGCGRSGTYFAHAASAVRPDLITLAKGMGNGFPVAAVLIAPHLKARHGLLGTTFGGNFLACAASIAVLDVLKSEDLMAKAANTGQWLSQELHSLPSVKEVRGQGLMIGIELDLPSAGVRKQLLSQYQIFTGSASNKNTLRILPPLCISKEELVVFLQAFRITLQTQIALAELKATE